MRGHHGHDTVQRIQFNVHVQSLVPCTRRTRFHRSLQTPASKFALHTSSMSIFMCRVTHRHSAIEHTSNPTPRALLIQGMGKSCRGSLIMWSPTRIRRMVHALSCKNRFHMKSNPWRKRTQPFTGNNIDTYSWGQTRWFEFVRFVAGIARMVPKKEPNSTIY